MNLCINTNYAASEGFPQLSMENISRAGFTHIMWAQEWNTDYIYSDSEIHQVALWLKEYNLALQDIHGSVGYQKNWFSTTEYQRQAGVDMIANRMKMLRELDGTGCVIMHLPRINRATPPILIPQIRKQVDALKKSLDELEKISRKLNVKLALENLIDDTFEVIKEILPEYPEDFLGLCYDSGHGNLYNNGLAHLETLKHRLIAIHLCDNNGDYDSHLMPFNGNINWEKLASIIKTSTFHNVPTFELTLENEPYKQNHERFLDEAFTRCSKVASFLLH